jgi:hypothetical protein
MYRAKILRIQSKTFARKNKNEMQIRSKAIVSALGSDTAYIVFKLFEIKRRNSFFRSLSIVYTKFMSFAIVF